MPCGRFSSRFGRSLPASIVLFSDGQARDAADVEEVAGYFSKIEKFPFMSFLWVTRRAAVT